MRTISGRNEPYGFHIEFALHEHQPVCVAWILSNYQTKLCRPGKGNQKSAWDADPQMARR
eukprot:4519233-Karenia_brevis.AAC.1